MKRIVLFLSFGVAAAFAADQTWTGQISDNMCGADHSAMAHDGKKADPHDCTLTCVKGGGKFVFVSEGKVFNIANQDFADLTTQAGHTVKLTGDLAGDGQTITVSKIQMEK